MYVIVFILNFIKRIFIKPTRDQHLTSKHPKRKEIAGKIFYILKLMESYTLSHVIYRLLCSTLSFFWLKIDIQVFLKS